MSNRKDVTHNWAHQIAPRGSSYPYGKAGNVFYAGESIYSYGHHFEAGRLVTNKKGETAALITTRTYSNSTAVHVSYANRAVSHLPRFNVPLDRNTRVNIPRDWFNSYKPRIREAMDNAGRARRNKEQHLETARRLTEEANQLARFFGLRSRLAMPADIEAALEAAREADRRRAKREAAARQKQLIQAAKERAELLQELEHWRAGTRTERLGGFYRLPAALRIANGEDGLEVETSHGAAVPLEHVKRAYKVFSRLRAKGETYARNGHTVHVGAFAVDSMDTAGTVRIGCHTIAWSEIERLTTSPAWAAAA